MIDSMKHRVIAMTRRLYDKPKRAAPIVTALTVAAWLLSSCAASSDQPLSGKVNAGNGSRVSVCKSTDTLIDSSDQCLMDDAACYQLSNGKWCTGERGNVCPAGSMALPDGSACPPGARCFRVGESLQCAIS